MINTILVILLAALMVIWAYGMVFAYRYGWPFTERWRAARHRRALIDQRQTELIRRGFSPEDAREIAVNDIAFEAYKTTRLLRSEGLES